MKTQTIKIGATRAVCIPPALLGEINLDEEVEISLEDGRFLIHPLRPAHIAVFMWLRPRVRSPTVREGRVPQSRPGDPARPPSRSGF